MANKKTENVLVAGCEVIEHLKEIENFWTLMRMLTCTVKSRLQIYLTLPIGKKIPSHSTYFLTEKEALRELERFIEVERTWLLKPPSEGLASPHHMACVCALGYMR